MRKAVLAWVTAVTFVLFQFAIQLSSGGLVHALMRDFALTATGAGFLTSSYYYIYALFQIPAGLLFDRYGARHILTLGAITAGLGCLLFGNSHWVGTAFLGRMAFGGGAACAFVGMLFVTRAYFLRYYGVMIGFAEMIGLLSSIVGTIGLAYLLRFYSWRVCFTYAGLFAIVIAIGCWNFIGQNIQGDKNSLTLKALIAQVVTAFKSSAIWLNGLYIAIGFSIITVYASLWATPFMMKKLNINLASASIVTSCCFLGAAFGCPLYGYLADKLTSRQPLLFFSSVSTALLMVLIIYLPSQNVLLHSFLNGLIGLCCASYMVSFSICDELSNDNTRNTVAGFTNTLAVVSATILQPFIGYLLDHYKTGKVYTLANYQHALMLLPGLLIIAAFIVFYLPKEKHVITSKPLSVPIK